MNFGKKIDCMNDLCKTDRNIWVAAESARICEKEIKESFDFAYKIRRLVRHKNVLEVCCGHGLVGNILITKGWSKYVAQTDIHETKAHERLLMELNNNARIFFYMLDILKNQKEIDKLEFDIVIGVHCCGNLTDEALDIALRNNKEIAVVPCCYHKSDEIEKRYMHLFGNLGLDIHRTNRLIEKGYDVRLKTLKANITPMNRVIVGLKQ